MTAPQMTPPNRLAELAFFDRIHKIGHFAYPFVFYCQFILKKGISAQSLSVAASPMALPARHGLPAGEGVVVVVDELPGSDGGAGQHPLRPDFRARAASPLPRHPHQRRCSPPSMTNK